MQTCKRCRGRGEWEEVYVWSDGPGMVSRRCPICEGSGEMEDDHELMVRLERAEAERASALAGLEKLRTYVALYFDAQEGRIAERVPDPNRSGYVLKDDGTTLYAHASNPSHYASTWARHLRGEAAKAPRRHSEYASGWLAALEGKPLPDDASELFARAYRFYTQYHQERADATI